MGRTGTKSLTAKQVETESRIGYHADALSTGLYLQVVQGSGRLVRSWVYRYTSPTTKTRRELGLGSTRTRSLADARRLATDLRLKVLDGQDPKDQRDAQRAESIAKRAQQMTFDEAVVQCIEAKSLEWRNLKHAQQWKNTLQAYASPVLGKLPVDKITTDLVYKTLQPIWVTKTETASRVRQRIEVVLDWCKARGCVSGENPARLKGALGELLPRAQKIKQVVHHAALPYNEVYQFVQTLRSMSGMAPLAFEFMILTATRTGEVVAAQWDEFDLASATWTIPAERMKSGRPHRVPLSVRAIAIIRTLQRSVQNDYVFPGHAVARQSHLSTGAFLAVMKRMDLYAQYTPHGFRSCFRDWGSEQTQFPNETLELALAHVIKNKAEAAYRRQDQLEKRRSLMQSWEDFIERPPLTAKFVSFTSREA